MPPSHHSHSHSSHSSRSSGGSSYSSARVRSNQLSGWNTARHGNTINYYFRDHDYVYYSHDWTNEAGVTFKEGYYDENGVHYTNIAAANVQTTLTCKYCGTKMLYKWQEGTIPNCLSCGGQIQIDKIDVAKSSSLWSSKRPLWISLIVYLGITFAFPVLCVTIAFFYMIPTSTTLPNSGILPIRTRTIFTDYLPHS